jgi:hypothetical protein
MRCSGGRHHKEVCEWAHCHARPRDPGHGVLLEGRAAHPFVCLLAQNTRPEATSSEQPNRFSLSASMRSNSAWRHKRRTPRPNSQASDNSRTARAWARRSLHMRFGRSEATAVPRDCPACLGVSIWSRQARSAMPDPGNFVGGNARGIGTAVVSEGRKGKEPRWQSRWIRGRAPPLCFGQIGSVMPE